MAAQKISANTEEGALIIQKLNGMYKLFDQTALTQNRQQFEPTQAKTLLRQ